MTLLDTGLGHGMAEIKGGTSNSNQSRDAGTPPPPTMLRRVLSGALVVTLGVGIGLVVGFQIKPTSPAAAVDACDLPVQNAIACENTLPGSPQSEWDVQGAGDPTIQGYGTDISVNKGNTIQFKINTDASAYTIDIYRLGYYGGDGARKVATITPTATLPQDQPDCLSDPTTGLVDCGNWAGLRELVGAVRRRVGDLHRASASYRHRWREPHGLHRPRRRQPLEAVLPDVRPRVAGLQQLRREQPLCRRTGGPRLQGELQPPVHHARVELADGLAVQL